MQNDANNDGVQDSDVCLIDTELGKQYSDWSFPNLTLRSGRSTFQSMILMYDDRAHIDDHYGAGNPDYDKDDKLMFRDGGDGLSAINAKITINNPHYMMITAKSNAGISVEAMEHWLRANVQWRSYDPTAKPAKITVYVDVENNLASQTNAVSQFFRSLLGAAPVIDAPGTVQENGTITFTSNAGYPAQWQMSEDGGKTFVDMPGETQPYLVIDTALSMMQGWQYRVRNASGDTSAPVTLQISNDITLLPVQAGGHGMGFRCAGRRGVPIRRCQQADNHPAQRSGHDRDTRLLCVGQNHDPTGICGCQSHSGYHLSSGFH